MNALGKHTLAAAALIGAALYAPALAASPDEALAKLSQQTLSKGPAGETPVSASTVQLSDDELAKIKAMGAKAAIVMHYCGNVWSQAQINGLKTEFKAMG